MAIETPIQTPGGGEYTGNSLALPPLPEAGSGMTGPGAPVDIHAALKDVQGMREFTPQQPGWLDELMKQPYIRELTDKIQTALENFLKALQDFFSGMQPPAVRHMPDHLVNLFTGITGFLVGLLALYAFYMLLSYLIRMQRRNAQRPEKLLNQAFDNALLINTRYHQEQAKALAASGNYGLAVRQLYYSALCLLDESGILPFEKTRTNFEYGQALANLAGIQVQQGFRQLSGTFEAARYGAQPMNAQQYDACRAELDKLAETSQSFSRQKKAALDE